MSKLKGAFFITNNRGELVYIDDKLLTRLERIVYLIAQLAIVESFKGDWHEGKRSS